MGKTIAIIDYGSGNLRSVENSFVRLGYEPLITSDHNEIDHADALVLPGVGAFGLAMDNLRTRNLVELLSEQVLRRRKPFLGICLGMQLLAEDSTEGGLHVGLGWLPGHVVRLDDRPLTRIPHVGWNEVAVVRSTPLFRNITTETTYYFDHSYHFMCDDAWVIAHVSYGANLVAAVQRDNIFAVQFHPEKSQVSGLKLLRNFLDFVESAATHSRTRATC